ncbi:hypothetical protein K8M07_08535 [Schnuerera sp. xch1]|uniref:hypothetical protein n=1 Tax=Schnuerera sp. xch1 TaxID=2874283 RepID=UPI001CC06691|nr:hypothetical protein [Schnuerera sp. xch1]MBZ2175294.1 hypothetical protein [Schnuerera sp. xch1]
MKRKNEANDKLDISSLSDEELENKIVNINSKQLSIIQEISYYFLFSSVGEISKLIKTDNFLNQLKIEDEKEIIFESYDIIINSFKKIHEKLSDEQIEHNIDLLIHIRKKLYHLSNSMTGYLTELSYMKELLDYHVMKILNKKHSKNHKISKKDVIFFINKVRRVLDISKNDYNSFVNLVSNILSIIPFRMSKYKYFDIIKTTLVRNCNNYETNLAKNKIEEYKMIFDSTLIGDYGIIFDDYFTKVQRIKNINFKNKNLDELNLIDEDIVNLSIKMHEINLFISNLGIIINRLLVLYLTKNRIDFTIDINDCFMKWKQYEEDMKDELLESITKTFEIEIKNGEKKLLEQMEFFDAISKEGANRKGFFSNDLNDLIIYTGKVLTYYNDKNFTKDELLFSEECEVVEEVYLYQLIDSLIQYINRSISSMNNVERKIRMRRLLSVIELPFKNIEEFLSYIEYSLDEKVTNIEDIVFAMNKINDWLDKYMER